MACAKDSAVVSASVIRGTIDGLPWRRAVTWLKSRMSGQRCNGGGGKGERCNKKELQCACHLASFEMKIVADIGPGRERSTFGDEDMPGGVICREIWSDKEKKWLQPLLVGAIFIENELSEVED